MLLSIFIIITILILIVMLFIRQSKFGKIPNGDRLYKIKKSINYKNGKFMNISHTPDLAEGVSYFKVMNDFFFKKSKRLKPTEAIPSNKTNLSNLDPQKDILVWFGHSSYFMQTSGKKILVDPVLSGSASPIRSTTLSFKGSDVYTTDDLPEIDYLFITHDHWDHLDHSTIIKLKSKVKKIVTSLGVGAHLESWGISPEKIIENDWNDEVILEEGFKINTISARHFSGRGFKRAQSIWCSFLLTTPKKKIYIGGDSGYDDHFKIAGKKFGPIDLAILECGQYNEYWRYIHMMPEETVQAAIDLKAKKLLPVHWAKFALGMHDWNEPIIRVVNAAEKAGLPIITPMIGEEVDLNEEKAWTKWWLS